jgi:hypothetical protein
LERARHGVRKYKYGITENDWFLMMEWQGSKCASCFKSFADPGENQHNVATVDHDHITGEVRGLLCGACNTALGCLGDDAQKIEQLLVYRKNFE